MNTNFTIGDGGSGDIEVETFLDSEEYSISYAYTYVVVILVMVLTSYHVAKKIRLQYESYTALEKIEHEMGLISLAIEALKIKFTLQSRNEMDSKKYGKVEKITTEMVLHFIDLAFVKIHSVIDNHHTRLKTKVCGLEGKILKKTINEMAIDGGINDSENNQITKSNTVDQLMLSFKKNEKKNEENDEKENHGGEITITTVTTVTTVASTNEDTESRKKQKVEENSDINCNEKKQENDKNDKNEMENTTQTEKTTNDNETSSGAATTSTIIIRESDEMKDNNIDLSILNDYINKQLKKYSLRSMKGIKSFFSIMWDIRQLMTIAVSHIFDTASDIALAIEWYILYRQQLHNPNYLNLQSEYNLDMAALFYCCIGVIIWYRISSAWQVYKFCGNISDAILQLILDVYLIKLIYINVAKMRSYKPLKLIKILRGIEGSHESGFQAVLTMVFLVKTNFTQISGSRDNSNIIAVLSLVLSLVSLISRFIFLDRYYLSENARTIGITMESLTDDSGSNKNIFSRIYENTNFWYIYHGLFRSIEIIFSILLFSLVWCVLGGMAVVISIIVILAVANLFTCGMNKFNIKKVFMENKIQTDILRGTLVYTLVNVMHWRHWQDITIYKQIKNKYIRRFAYSLTGWILPVARLIFCICITLTQFLFDNNNYDYSYFVIICNLLYVISCIMLYICIKYYVEVNIYNDPRIRRLEVLPRISQDDTELILFCKHLNIDIFTKTKYHKIKRGFNGSSNVLGAMIMSNNIDNYYIIKDWYDNVTKQYNNNNGIDGGKDDKYKLMNFDEFLKSVIPWDIGIIWKLIRYCDSLDYYKLLFDKLERDFDITDDKFGVNLLSSCCARSDLPAFNPDIIEYLLEKYSQIKRVKIDNDADMSSGHGVNHTNKFGWTALHQLMRTLLVLNENEMNKNNIKMLKARQIGHLLIKYGIDENKQLTENGLTAKSLLQQNLRHDLQFDLYHWITKD